MAYHFRSYARMSYIPRGGAIRTCLGITFVGALLIILFSPSQRMHDPHGPFPILTKHSFNASNNNESQFFSAITSTNHSNCLSFRQRFPMITRPDGDMNVAFTIVVHKDVLQVARLLRMIYRVNNYYCIHLDARSSRSFQEAMNGVAACFGSNVELVPVEKRSIVEWGDESVLRPQLICAEQALQRNPNWTYLVNIVGQEFPLKTNLELVAALKALNGSNLVEAFPIDRFKKWVGSNSLPLKVSFKAFLLY